MLSDDKRAALIEICHDADVRLIRDSKFGHPDYTSVQSSWPALEKLSVAVAEAAVKAERVTASHWQSLYEAQVALNETMHRREIRNEAAVKDAVGGRDREADRHRFPDPAFNRWLDESITENGEFSVWHQLGDVATAWAAWESRPHYKRKTCDLCDCTGDIHDQTGEWRGECPYCRPQASAAVPSAADGGWNRIVLGKGLVGIHSAISDDGIPRLVFSKLGSGVVGDIANHQVGTEFAAEDILCEVVVETEAAFMVLTDVLYKLYASPQASAAVPEGFVLVDAAALIRWRSALAEELVAYDIEPPLHHVKTSHDEIDALLKSGGAG